MKILNLYAGIGGNRKLWGDEHEVTAVEYIPEIAQVYQDNFPNDTVIIADAHQYLLDHYKEYDFIWSSPPCPTHSDIRRCGVHAGQVDAKYPEMSLYQEIILLRFFAPKHTKWVVENVKPYYEPLIQPSAKLHRHYLWTNFLVRHVDIMDKRKHEDISGSSEVYGFNLDKYDINDKRKILRNMVNPELGLYVLQEAGVIKDDKILVRKQESFF